MNREPDANAPPPAAPAPASEESDVRSPSPDRDSGADEEHARDVDPHPDTADDFDDDASSPRESIETVHDPGGDDDD